MRWLNAQDDQWLAIDTPSNPMQIGALLHFEATSERPAEAFDAAVRAHLLRRLPATPLQVVYRPGPFHFDNGAWLDLDRIDLDRHVQRLSEREPVTPSDLHAFVARQVVAPWEPGLCPFRVFVFDRVADDRVALVLQSHHALADGVGFQAIIRALTDADAGAADPPDQAGPPAAHRARTDRMPPAPIALARSALRFARVQRDDRRRAEERARAAAELKAFREQPGSRRARTPTVPGMPERNSRERVYTTAQIPLEALVRVGKAWGGTVNDAFLTLMGGALRRQLREMGALEALGDKPLVGLQARSLRQTEHGDYGNHLVMLLPQLGTHLEDPRARFESVRASMRAEITRSDLAGRMSSSPERPFGARRRRAAEPLAGGGNVALSNVPGPAEPRFLAGYRMLANYPAPNLPVGQFLNATMRRYVDMLDLGLIADPTMLPDIEGFRDRLHGELDALTDVTRD